MADIVGVRYKRAGRIYYFDSAGIDLVVSDNVVVETSRGLDLGWVVIAPTQVSASEIAGPLKPVVRKATDEDVGRAQELEGKKEEALAECQRLVGELSLPMGLIDADLNLDDSRLTVYFTAEGRVDFRELVRELSKSLKMRVELRQVGPRDEAKLLGGFGRCGRTLCCQSFITEFSPVSIKMAKAQDLPLNPMKISGVCGRLLCCLNYEYEQYRSIRKKLPRKGEQVPTPKGMATVIGSNPLKETVLVKTEGGVSMELPLSEITVGAGTESKKKDGPEKAGSGADSDIKKKKD